MRAIETLHMLEPRARSEFEAVAVIHEIRAHSRLATPGFKMVPAEVKFLGVWDTVPGSQLIEYGECKEVEDERENKGDRYKSSAYPAIRNIAHALSADEKRSKFAPIRICGSVESRYPTLVDEVWFPGAHADVGGGYDDDKEKGLPGISFNWMLRLLKGHYPPAERLEPVYASSAGLAHWSVGDSPANKGSRCGDRMVPAGATMDASIAKRTKASPVDVRAAGKVKKREYPIKCPPGGGRDI